MLGQQRQESDEYVDHEETEGGTGYRKQNACRHACNEGKREIKTESDAETGDKDLRAQFGEVCAEIQRYRRSTCYIGVEQTASSTRFNEILPIELDMA